MNRDILNAHSIVIATIAFGDTELPYAICFDDRKFHLRLPEQGPGFYFEVTTSKDQATKDPASIDVV